MTDDRIRTSTETIRIEAFSDGVFAIAITLLILEIRPPAEVARTQGLTHALLMLWPSYFAFATSFFTIGIMWLNHHRLFTMIGCTDHTLMLLNLLLLLGVTFLPFPTTVLAGFLGTEAERTAAIFYSGTFVYIAVVFNLLWRYAATNGRLIADDADRAVVASQTRQYLFGPVFYSAALGLAFFSAKGSVALNLLLALFFALPPKKVS